MDKRTFSSSLILMALWISAMTASAQELTATLFGRVTDPTGAVVPGAEVVVRNMDTGFSRTLRTDSEGNYVATYLPIGRYQLIVEAPGFKRFVRENILLSVNDRVALPVTLQVGEIQETVTVTAEEVLVQQSPTISGLVSGRQMTELPLNNRNFVQLTYLVPGVSSALPSQVGFGGLSVISISVSGSRTSGINWLIDGGRNVDTGSNLTLFNYPSVDAVAEFRILTNVYSAEFGRNAGGVVNIITKSGTREFHGGAYYFVRNDAIAAREPFRFTPPIVGRTSLKPPLRYNNFGWNIGGPVTLFGYNTAREKTFFFFSQEFRRIREFTTPRTTVPTAAMRRGDFSGLPPITDPQTRQPFPGNIIPADRIDPNARIILERLFPLPNAAAEGDPRFYRPTLPQPVNFRQELWRVDHVFTPRFRVWARYIRDIFSRVEPGGLFNSILLPDVATTATDTPAVNFKVAATHVIGARAVSEFAYDFSRNQILSDIIGRGKRSALGLKIPEIFPGNRDLVPNISISGFATISFFGPYRNGNPSHSFTYNFTYTTGRHTFKAGAFVATERKFENSGGNPVDGSFTFDGRFTGNALADFLLGLASSYTEDQVDVNLDLRYNTYEFYAQDSWKVRPNLTVDFGVRFSMFGNPVEKNNLLQTFRPDLYRPERAVQLDARGFIIPGSGDRFNGMIFSGENSPFGRRVQENNFDLVGPRFGFAWDPTGRGKAVLRGGYGIYYDRSLTGIVLQNGFVNPKANTRVTIDNALLSNPAAGITRETILPISLLTTGFPFRAPTMQQWNLSYQREIFPQTLFEIGYVGSGGNNLLRLININQPRPLAATQAGGVINRVRPYLGYALIQERQTTGISRYHSLQMSLQKRMSRGFSLGGVYTWGKNMTTASTDRSDAPQDSLNIRAERAPSSFQRQHVLTINYIWELPALKEANPAVRALLGGWQISGITTFWSGLPFTVVQSGDTLLVGPFPAGGATRPDLIANPRLPKGQRTAARWFTTEAFRRATTTFGTAGRNIIRAAGVNNWDISVMKNFALTENARLQFRAEFFNAFNHTQLGAPGATLGVAGFGSISSARDPRIIQFGLKLSF